MTIMASIQEKRHSLDAEIRGPSSEGSGDVQDVTQMSKWKYFRHYVTSRDGWLGDYVSFLWLPFFEGPCDEQTKEETRTYHSL